MELKYINVHDILDAKPSYLSTLIWCRPQNLWGSWARVVACQKTFNHYPWIWLEQTEQIPDVLAFDASILNTISCRYPK